MSRDDWLWDTMGIQMRGLDIFTVNHLSKLLFLGTEIKSREANYRLKVRVRIQAKPQARDGMNWPPWYEWSSVAFILASH